MTPRTSVASLLAGLVLCCSLCTSPVRGSEPTVQVVPAVRHVATADDDASTVTTVGWRHFARRAYRHSYYGHYGWGRGLGHYGFYGSYPGYYGGYAPYYATYPAPLYRTTYYAPTYVAPAYYAPTYVAPSYYAPAYYTPSYSLGYAPVVYSYRPYYYTPSVRVLYGGYGYYGYW